MRCNIFPRKALPKHCAFKHYCPRLRPNTRDKTASFVTEKAELASFVTEKVVDSIKSGMVLGLGTGSTTAFAVGRIGELLSSGALSDIVGIPTSKCTAEQATSLGIPLSGLDHHPRLYLAIDGADKVDPNVNLVKVRGGALLREKMVEVAVVDYT